MTIDAIYKFGRIILASILTICLTVLYYFNPDINPELIQYLLVVPGGYVLGKTVEKMVVR